MELELQRRLATEGLDASLPQEQCRGELSGPKPGAARLLVLDSEGLDRLRSCAYCR